MALQAAVYARVYYVSMDDSSSLMPFLCTDHFVYNVALFDRLMA